MKVCLLRRAFATRCVASDWSPSFTLVSFFGCSTSLFVAMLIFASVDPPPSHSHTAHPVLALALPFLLALLLVVEVISWGVRAARRRRRYEDNGAARTEEVQAFFERVDGEEGRRGAERLRTVLELFKVVGGAGLLGVSLMKLVGRPLGGWEEVLDLGVALVAVRVRLSGGETRS